MTKVAWLLALLAPLAVAASCATSESHGFTTTTSGSGGETSTWHTDSTASLSTTTAGTGGGPVKVGCDPFTGAPCHVENGMTCDWDNSSSSFVCFPGPNTAKLCESCQGAVYCGLGLHCVPDTLKCAAWCCDDGDCGEGGRCDKTYVGDPNVGVCFTTATDAGLPAHTPACAAPAQAPSGSACVPK